MAEYTRSQRTTLRTLGLVCIALTVASCRTNASTQQYGFVALLGVDTVSVERVTRRGDELTSEEVDRFPRVRRRHTTMHLAANGTIDHLEMDIETPSEPLNERHRHVVADVRGDSVRITKRDSTGAKSVAFATGGALTMPHLPQMYSLTELYFGAALRRAHAVGDSVQLRQYYIDREFDHFPLHQGVVTLRAPQKAEIHHDWLAGYGDATFDLLNRMLTYSGARSTYKIEVRRIDTLPDIEAIGARFAALETSTGGARQLSVRDTARAAIGAANLAVDYGRPLARKRVLLGNILPYDEVWRTGANAATQLTVSAPVTIAGIRLAKGTYTLWTVPRANGSAELIVNSQFGQWGTEYDDKRNVGHERLMVDSTSTPVEKFTISIVPAGDRKGTLAIEWGAFRWSAPIVAE